MKTTNALKNKNQKNYSNSKKVLDSSSKIALNSKRKKLTMNKLKHRYETYMKFVKLISKGLRKICPIFNPDVRIEYKKEVSMENNTEKNLRNLPKKNYDKSSLLPINKIINEKINISQNIEKKSITRFLRKFIKNKNESRNEKLKYYFNKWLGEQRENYKSEKIIKTIRVRIEFSKEKKNSHFSQKDENKEKIDKKEKHLKKTGNQENNIIKHNSVIQNDQKFKKMPIKKLNSFQNKNKINNQLIKSTQMKNNNPKQFIKQIKPNNTEKNTLKSKSIINNLNFSNNIKTPTKKISFNEKKANTNKYSRNENADIRKKIYCLDKSPCSFCSVPNYNYSINNTIIHNNIFNCLNNNISYNKGNRNLMDVISNDSMCSNSNNIESCQIINKCLISDKNNNFRNLFCLPRKTINLINDESSNFTNVPNKDTSCDNYHRIRKINISQKENKLRNNFQKCALYSKNPDYLFNKNMQNKNITFNKVNNISNNKSIRTIRNIDYNDKRNSYNYNDNFKTHYVSSINYYDSNSTINNSEIKERRNSFNSGKITVFQHFKGIKKVIDNYNGNIDAGNLNRISSGKKTFYK